MSTPAPNTPEFIRDKLRRVRTALTRLESAGRGTAVTRARIDKGLTCRIEDGAWSFTADLPEKGGGAGEGPDPGVYGRAALASCLAIGYTLWAADHELPIDALEVEVQADYDARAEYGIGEADPGYEALRWIVRIESPAPEVDIRRMLEIAEARSPYLALFRDPQRLERTLELTPTKD